MITLSQFEEMLKKEWISYFPEQYQHGEVFFHEKRLRNGGSLTQVVQYNRATCTTGHCLPVSNPRNHK